MKKLSIHIIFSVSVLFLSSIAASGPLVPTGLCINNLNCSDAALTPANYNPGYYLTVGQSKEEPAIVFGVLKDLSPDWKGGKRIYRWVDLEPRKGVYDFSRIEADLAYLRSINKELFIQLFYTQFNGNGKPQVPNYMWNDPQYGCGTKVDGTIKYYGSFQRNTGTGGWIPCYWNRKLRERIAALYTALGERFSNEPNFEGIAIDETAADFYAAQQQTGYDLNELLETFKAKALAARQSFPDKVVMQHINFAAYSLADFAAWLAQNNIGIGGPDVYLSNRVLLENTYPLYLKYHNHVVTGQDVQWQNYVQRNTFLGRTNTPEELLLGAIKETNPRYIFWQRRDPYFFQEGNGVVDSVKKHGLPPAAQKYYEGDALF